MSGPSPAGVGVTATYLKRYAPFEILMCHVTYHPVFSFAQRTHNNAQYGVHGSWIGVDNIANN